MFHDVVRALLLVLSLCVLLALVYIITAKHFEDRVVGSNLVSTIVINIVAVLAVFVDESFVVDICLVFAALGFLGVVVLCRLLAVQFVEKQMDEEGKKKTEEEKGGVQA